MWWHLTLVGASESDGLVPTEDVTRGVGWSYAPGDGPDVSVAWLDQSEPDPSQAIRVLAGRPSEYREPVVVSIGEDGGPVYRYRVTVEPLP